MPLWKCKKCVHEWEALDLQTCSWCGSKEAYVLEEKTPFERWVEDFIENQTELDSEAKKILADNFWDVYEKE